MNFPSAPTIILALPVLTALLLAALPSYRLSAAIKVAPAFLAFVAWASLFAYSPPSNDYIHIDDLNVVFIVLNTFVGFTAALCSATYIAHEI